MFRATHRSSSGAQKLYLQPLVLHTSVVAGRQPQTYVKSFNKDVMLLLDRLPMTDGLCPQNNLGYRQSHICNTLLFYGNNGYANAPRCYVIRTLSVSCLFALLFCSAFVKLFFVATKYFNKLTV